MVAVVVFVALVLSKCLTDKLPNHSAMISSIKHSPSGLKAKLVSVYTREISTGNYIHMTQRLSLSNTKILNDELLK